LGLGPTPTPTPTPTPIHLRPQNTIYAGDLSIIINFKNFY